MCFHPVVYIIPVDQPGPILYIGPGPMINIGPGPMYYMGLAYYWQVRIL